MKFITIFAVLFLTIPMEVYGASCDQMASSGYCLNSMYRKTMCTSCTSAFDKLGGYAAYSLPTKTSVCSDQATNCACMAHLCTNPLYNELLATKCSSTCNTFDGKPATTTTATSPTTTTTVKKAK